MRESAFDERKKKPGLKFNPRLALTSLRTILVTQQMLDVV